MAKYASQQRFDGIDIQHHQIRFGGTLDIDDDDLDEIRLDGLTVLMVAVRSDGADVKILADSGEARLKYVLTAQVAVPLTGEMRERGLAYLRDRDGQMDIPDVVVDSTAPAAGGYADPVPAPIVTPEQPAAPVGIDPTTGEVSVTSPDEPGMDTPIEDDRESRPIERSGPPVDDSPPKPGAFQVAGFDIDDAPGPPPPPQPGAPVVGDVETVGNVHREDRKGDEVLDNFLAAAD